MITNEMDVAPTYFPEEAATKIQSFIRRIQALYRVRLMYKDTYEEVFDFYSGTNYYANRFTYASVWELPKFMGGKYDHTKKYDTAALDDVDSQFYHNGYMDPQGYHNSIVDIKVKDGTCLMFDGGLHHSTTPNLTDHKRITLAANFEVSYPILKEHVH